MRKLAVLVLVLSWQQATFAGFEIGGDFSYFSINLSTRAFPALTTNQTTAMTGPLFTGYAHLTVELPQVILIGFGPTLAYSNPSAPDATKIEEAVVTRFGGELKFQIESWSALKPYGRLGLGKDTISWTERGTVATGSYIADATAGGLFYTAALGAQVPFTSEFALYAQVGYTASPGSRMLVHSYAVAGVNQVVNVPADPDTSYAGWIASAGGRLLF